MHVCRSLVVVACSAASIACGDDSPLQPSPVPLPTRLELTGPRTIAPGSVGLFTLTAFFADGTSADATATSMWCCSTNVLQVEGAGRFLGRAPGETTISVTYGRGLLRTQEVLVLPAGTFRVTGRVFEPGLTVPVANARVVANDDAGGSVTADADSSGFFRLFGVPPNAELVVSRTGYITQSLRHKFSDHSSIALELPLASSRLDLAGTYTATFDWRSCTDRVPADERRRAITAVVTQAGSALDVRFSAPTFIVNSAARGNMMQGYVGSADILLHADRGFAYYYYGPTTYPHLIERLPDRWSIISGTAVMKPSASGFAGEWQGSLAISTVPFPYGGDWIGGCQNAALSFTDRR